MDTKRVLRSRVLADRERRAAADREAAGAAIAALGLEQWRDASVVAGYAATGTEPPTRLLLDRLREAGTDVVLPVIAGDRLEWAPYESWDALVAGPFGIAQPETKSRVLLGDVAVVIVPALAVDRHGNRLGRGAGYYDRALADIPRDRIVALLYDDELVDVIPVESHDVAVAAVLTPSGLVACR